MEFKKPIYPIEQWNITETEFKKENNYRNETTFALHRQPVFLFPDGNLPDAPAP